jgi:hypothetical protein
VQAYWSPPLPFPPCSEWRTGEPPGRSGNEASAECGYPADRAAGCDASGPSARGRRLDLMAPVCRRLLLAVYIRCRRHIPFVQEAEVRAKITVSARMGRHKCAGHHIRANISRIKTKLLGWVGDATSPRHQALSTIISRTAAALASTNREATGRAWICRVRSS